MRLWKNRDRRNFDDLSSRVTALEQKIKVLELDLELYVRRLKVTKGLGKAKEETKHIKDNVFLNPDGTFLSEEQKKRIS